MLFICHRMPRAYGSAVLDNCTLQVYTQLTLLYKVHCIKEITMNLRWFGRSTGVRTP